jgi:hypothetical protein
MQDPHPVKYAVLTLYPQHACAIADVIANWSRIERSLYAVLAVLLKTHPDHAYAMMSSLVTPKGRLDVVSAVGNRELGNDALLPEFRRLMKALRAAYDKRIAYAHGIFVVNRSEELCILNKGVRFDRPMQSSEMRILDIKSLAGEAMASAMAASDLIAFHEKLLGRLSPETIAALRGIWFPPDRPGQPRQE